MSRYALVFAWWAVLPPQDKPPAALPRPFPSGEAKYVIRGKVRAGRLLEGRRLRPSGTYAKRYERLADEDRLANAIDLTLPNVFVWVQGLDQKWKFEVPDDVVEIRCEAGRFVPHVVGVVGTQQVRLTNAMPERLSWGFLTERSVWGRTPAPEESFAFRPKRTGFFRSDSHPWMTGRIHMRPHPFFAVTDADGRFRLPALPEGAYQLAATHELLGTVGTRLEIKGRDPRPVTLVFAPHVTARMTERERRAVAEDLAKLLDVATSYQRLHRAWPPRLEALLSFNGRWPYRARLLRFDPWGRRYWSFSGDDEPGIASSGPDGFPGTADDLTTRDIHDPARRR